MTNLTNAHNELFRRLPDESFASLSDLMQRCQAQKDASLDRWHLPQVLALQATDGRLTLQAGNDGAFLMNDWSFSQLCGLAGVSKHTANVRDALSQIRPTLLRLVELRDQRRDGFVRVMQKAVESKLGNDAEEVMKELTKSGIHRTYVSSIELGKVQVSIGIARKLAIALQTPLSRIWRDVEQELSK